MNQNVVNYLGGSATVADLLQLANDVLGGSKVPGVGGVPSYADVNDAVDCINKSFDEGRRFLDYYDTNQTCELLFPAPIILPTTSTITSARTTDASTTYGVTVTAYPNPFSDNISFQIETKQPGQGSLEVYNMAGQKIKTVFSGYLNAGTQRFKMNVPVNQRSVLFYIFRMGDQKAAGKILHNGSY
jgi:hypothetical protein